MLDGWQLRQLGSAVRAVRLVVVIGHRRQTLDSPGTAQLRRAQPMAGSFDVNV
ncbi:hypothetical protein ABT373_15195 [Streptomyces sp. NPDC000070]|uniref:hypothetical protein n=1 Tax=Streptomyces sp. NPDC000070 TaxID=3154240 RepID=UPI00332F9505